MRDVMRVETMDELKQAFFEELVARQREADTAAVESATETVAAVAKVDRTAETVVSDAEETDAVAQQTAVNANACEEENVAHTTGTVADATTVGANWAADEAADGVKAARRRAMDLNCRMRCWTDGLVIGSEKFVREVMYRARGVPIDSAHRVMKLDAGADRDDLCAWRRLRASGG